MAEINKHRVPKYGNEIFFLHLVLIKVLNVKQQPQSKLWQEFSKLNQQNLREKMLRNYEACY